MIFSTIVIILILAIGFFHYLQGLFSATLSAVCAIVAAGLALSLHEPLVAMLLGGKFADQSYGIALVVLFAAIYTLLRIAFDGLVPGNVRLPAIVDKVGGAVMGIIAGIFATGIMALAGQSLPFGPSIAQYTPYETVDERPITVAGRRGPQNINMSARDELTRDTFDPFAEQSLMVPADRMVLGVVGYLSDGGSLAGARPLQSIHPDYVEELFGNRLGIQVGAKRTAQNLSSVEGPFTVESLTQFDAEPSNVRTRQLPSTLRPEPDQMLLILRVIFEKNSSDKDWLFRFSPASVRLVANGVNYYPIGTLENATQLMANRVDDFLFVDLKEADRGADLVFLVRKEDVLGTPEVGASSELAMANGAFVEAKRMARHDLSGKDIIKGVLADERVQVLRKGAPPERQRRSSRSGGPADMPPGMMPPPGGPPGMPPPPGMEPGGVPMNPAGVPSAR